MTLDMPEEVHAYLPALGKDSGAECSIDEILAVSARREVLNEGQIQDLRVPLDEFQGLFSSKPGRTDLITHEIELTSTAPIRSKAYRMKPGNKKSRKRKSSKCSRSA